MKTLHGFDKDPGVRSMVSKVRIYARQVGTKDKGKADAWSRLDLNRFRRLGGNCMNDQPSVIPEELWPISKIWLY